ncbi:rho-related BTB domain-containing protein 3 [Discoglossus pictus]
MTVNIVLLGNERGQLPGEDAQQNLASLFLGRRASTLLIEDSHEVFTIYQARIWGNIQAVIHECLSWDSFDGDLQSSLKIIGGADIVVIKYSVTDKTSFLDVKDNFAPLIKQIFSHCSVPVIIAAIGVRQNDGVPCTCPLCTSDRSVCVTSCEGIQLAKDLSATYLELHALNDFCVGIYFGGLLEYLIIQTLKRKSASEGKKKKKNNRCLKVKPPQLEQPEKMPVLKDEPSQYVCDFQNLLSSCQCVDVILCTASLEPVCDAHRIILCSASSVFTRLFSDKSAGHCQDSSALSRSHALFSVCKEDAVTQCNSPIRVAVKDSLFCSCLPDILHFIYSGASQWSLLELRLRKKLKDSGDIARVLQRVRFILKVPRKDEYLADFSPSNSTTPWHFSNSLGQFFNNPFLADVFFRVQDTTIPAHRAVLVARCEVMAAMFNGNYMEANNFIVPVYGISKDTFLAFLEYLYTDCCCPASILQAMSLLICSEMYQVSRLQHICERYIITQLQSMPSRELSATSLSVVSLFRKAKFHNSESLSTWLLHFIATNYLIFSQKTEFQELSAEERDFVEMHRWPSNVYLKQLADYRKYVHSEKCRCRVM